MHFPPAGASRVLGAGANVEWDELLH